MSKEYKGFKVEASSGAYLVSIYGDIGTEVRAADVKRALSGIPSSSEIELRVTTDGGHVLEGTAIYNLIKQHPGRVVAYVDGVAASMGSLIIMAADYIYIAENAYLMIHNPSGGAVGESADLQKAADFVGRVQTTMRGVYSARSGKSDDDMQTIMDAETWYIGQEAVDAGFADEVVAATVEDMAAHIKPDTLTAYKNIPDSLLDSLTDPSANTGGSVNAPVVEKDQKEVFIPSAVAGKTTTKEAINMTKETKVEAATTDSKPVVAVKSEDVLKAEIKAEEVTRKTEIKAVFEGFDDHKDTLAACLDDMDCSIVQAKDKLLDKLGKSQVPTQARQVRVTDSPETGKFLEDAGFAISARAGLATDDERKNLSSNGLRGYTLFELGRMSLERRGVSTQGMDKMAVVAAAFTHTSSDFSSLLANSANKAMLKGYEEAEEVFQLFTASGTLPDFKTLSRVDTGTFPSLREVGEGGEYKHITLGERAESAVLATYGELFSITRQAIINDDLGAFTRIPQKMGRAAVRTVGDLVFNIFLNNPTMADGSALFHADHSNLASASGINTAGLDAARVLMANQKDGEATLNIRPKYLLTGPGDESAAKVAVESEFEVGASTKNNTIPNSARGLAQVISDARITTAHDSWYLLADQNMHDTIEVLYLDGNSAPVLEQQAGWNIDGTEFKVRMDAAAKAWDAKGMVKTPKS